MRHLDALLLCFLVIGSLLLFGASFWLRLKAWHQRGMERVRRYEQWVETGILGPVGPTREFRSIARTAQVVCLFCVASTLSAVAAPALGSMTATPPRQSDSLETTTTSGLPAITETSPAQRISGCGQEGLAKPFQNVPPAIAGPAESTIQRDGLADAGCPTEVLPVHDAWITVLSGGEILITSADGYNSVVPTGPNTLWFGRLVTSEVVTALSPPVEAENANLQLATLKGGRCTLLFSSKLNPENTNFLAPSLSAAFVNLVIEQHALPYNVWLNRSSLDVFETSGSSSPITITLTQEDTVQTSDQRAVSVEELRSCDGAAFLHLANGGT